MWQQVIDKWRFPAASRYLDAPLSVESEEERFPRAVEAIAELQGGGGEHTKYLRTERKSIKTQIHSHALRYMRGRDEI